MAFQQGAGSLFPELVLQELPRKSKFLGRAVLCLLENAVGGTAGGERWHRGLCFEIGHTALKSPVAKRGGVSRELQCSWRRAGSVSQGPGAG